MTPNPPPRRFVLRTSIARLVARLYLQAAPAERAQLLQSLLRPVGPLALAAIAAGAFARLLPPVRWQGVQVTAADAEHFGAAEVFELVRYVEQKSPELLWQLPQLVGEPRLWLSSATGALLLMALRHRARRAAARGKPPPPPPG